MHCQSFLQLSFPIYSFFFDFVLDAFFFIYFFLVAPQNTCTILCKCLHNVIPSDGFPSTNHFSMKKKASKYTGKEISGEFTIVCINCVWTTHICGTIGKEITHFFICHFIPGLKLATFFSFLMFYSQCCSSLDMYKTHWNITKEEMDMDLFITQG